MPEDGIRLRSRRFRDSTEPCRALVDSTLIYREKFLVMTTSEQDRWSRVKGRLRTTVGEDVYTSWFARMDLEGVQEESVRLSVPTRFLKSWIQAHYAERVLSCWQAEMPEVHRIDLTVRSAVRPRRSCARPRPRRSLPIMTRSAARRSIRA